MKKAELFFTVLSIPIDFVMIVGASLAAYFIRFGENVQNIRPVTYIIPYTQYVDTTIILAAGWIIIFAISGLYSTNTQSLKINQLLPKIISACASGILVVILTIFFRKEELFSSRFIVLAIGGLSILFVFCGRILLKIIQRLLYQYKIGNHRAVIIGNNKISNALAEEFKKNIGLGFSLSKNFANFDTATEQTLLTWRAKQQLDDIFQTNIENISENNALRDFCDEYQVAFHYAADLFGARLGHFSIDTINSVPFIEIKKTPLDGWGRIIKRITDIIGAICGLILFSPVLIITAILIKLDSPGSIIYKNKRVSKNGIFSAYKFRYMKTEHCTGDEYGGKEALGFEEKLISEQNLRRGPLYKIANDPRKTRVGKWIERLSIDDLPQFFNVLIGNMSLVGPRPHQPREVAKYDHRSRKLLSIKPGLTGLAQISGRSDLDFEDEATLDLYYIEHWTIWRDMYIILKTPFVLLKRRKNFAAVESSKGLGTSN